MTNIATMPIRRRTKQEGTAKVLKASTSSPLAKDEQKKMLDEKIVLEKQNQLIEEHLPPFPLVMAVLICSGALWVLAFRDVFATGRNIGGSLDEKMLIFTKSTDFFSNEKGWKSQQGGLSAIQQVTTDANNMGGLFVRKVGGAASLAVQTQKLFPLLFHPTGAQWSLGHFNPVFYLAAIGNIATIVFYSVYAADFAAADADGLVNIICGALTMETFVIIAYLITGKFKTGSPVTLPEGKIPTSVVSRIVSKTITFVTGFMTIIWTRDLLFPGEILPFPRDDIYLEWTGAFLHSPPEGSAEDSEHGMETALFVADKFLSQFMALNMLILCCYKFTTAYFIKYGIDGSGKQKCRMIWKSQTIGDSLILFMFRLFANAAFSASLDLKWHLMAMAYETFLLGLFGFL
mmetsp:Transcript_28810/g.44288  ORF Transcript_28810/g.44288 Transcript_28810/m.44288 type:complete len:403 (+) Transcript_28810:3-1211(+)